MNKIEKKYSQNKVIDTFVAKSIICAKAKTKLINVGFDGNIMNNRAPLLDILED